VIIWTFSKLTDSVLFAWHDKCLPFISTHYVVLYPQNGDRNVTINYVTSYHPMYSCILFVYYGMPSVLWRCWLGGKKGIRPTGASIPIYQWRNWAITNFFEAGGIFFQLKISFWKMDDLQPFCCYNVKRIFRQFVLIWCLTLGWSGLLHSDRHLNAAVPPETFP